MSVMQVELADLRGWARQVERAGTATSNMSTDAPGTIADGDFGRILELVTGEYESLLPEFHAILAEDGERLDRTASALRAVAHDYAETDRRVANEFDNGAPGITDDFDASGFTDPSPVNLTCPYFASTELPDIKFGFPFDQACGLAQSIGLPDPRDYVTKWIVGDIGKATSQAGYWEMYASSTRQVHANLSSGHAAISHTWKGKAADKARARSASWLEALKAQSEGMDDMAGHLRDMIEQAMDMAQTVVDTIKFFISTIAAGWTNAYIPIYGQIKLVDKVKDAWHLINNARKVLSVFWSFLVVIKDVIKSMYHVFTVTDLPPAPVAGN